MKKILQTIVLIVVVAALAILLYRWLFPPSEEIAELRQRIVATQALVDSLTAVNATLREEINGLRSAENRYVARIDSIRRVADDRQNRLRQLERAARLFPGTPDSLLRELNYFARTPISVRPD